MRRWMVCFGAWCALSGESMAQDFGQQVTNRGDERVQLLPTYARGSEDGSTWRIKLRGWVFEPEAASFKRMALARSLSKMAGLDSGSEAADLLAERLRCLTVDHEAGKLVKLVAGDVHTAAGPTSFDGRFEAEVVVESPGDAPIPVRFEGRDHSGSLEVPRVSARGWSVVSDIDDTIKVTEVLDRRKLLENTFLKPFAAVTGMPEAYTRWARSGVFFHYVSASPEQLVEPLVQFAATAGLPIGSWHLRNVHWSDNDPIELVKAPEGYKLDVISEIISGQPGRAFVLVGDSGERDPEVYGELARQFPAQVRGIHIRRVSGAANDDARFEAAFRELARDLWSLFDDPRTLPAALALAPLMPAR